jgi:hypothetical protein
VLARRWISHWNVGTTLIPSASNEVDQRAAIRGYNLGQSLIFAAHRRLHLMLETAWNGSEVVVATGHTQRIHTLLVSPGVRWAYNLSHGLQIVPGVAFPIGVGPSTGEKALLLYLSFEHPFGKGAH